MIHVHTVRKCHNSLLIGNERPGLEARAAGWNFEAERTRRGQTSGIQDGRRLCAQIEGVARTYERPALRKSFAAFPADSKVA
jgi:hypothetical protein